jgi:hypothetical protein
MSWSVGWRSPDFGDLGDHEPPHPLSVILSDRSPPWRTKGVEGSAFAFAVPIPRLNPEITPPLRYPYPKPVSTDKNKLYYGDNLEVLQRYVNDESVDLVYLDPPFNSRQDYNVLFAEKDGSQSSSQIHAFEDTWEWNIDAQRAYEQIVQQGGRVAERPEAPQSNPPETEPSTGIVPQPINTPDSGRVLHLMLN